MNHKILIVDDDPDIRKMCREALSNEEYEVVTSGSGEEAYDLAKKECFSVVLSDIRMPGMSGMELLAELKKLNPDSSVIMFSGFGDVDTAVEAMKQGAFDYLSKPLILDELKITIQMAIQQNQIRLENQKLKAQVQDTRSAFSKEYSRIPLLHKFSDEELEEFLKLGEARTFNAQEVIIEEGVTDKNLYILLEGVVSIWQEGAELYRLGRFDTYNEITILRSNLRSQCLIAETMVNLLVIDKDLLMAFFYQKEERLFKLFIVNTLTSVFLKLRKACNRINQLERLLKD